MISCLWSLLARALGAFGALRARLRTGAHDLTLPRLFMLLFIRSFLLRSFVRWERFEPFVPACGRARTSLHRVPSFSLVHLRHFLSILSFLCLVLSSSSCLLLDFATFCDCCYAVYTAWSLSSCVLYWLVCLQRLQLYRALGAPGTFRSCTQFVV